MTRRMDSQQRIKPLLHSTRMTLNERFTLFLEINPRKIDVNPTPLPTRVHNGGRDNWSNCYCSRWPKYSPYMYGGFCMLDYSFRFPPRYPSNQRRFSFRRLSSRDLKDRYKYYYRGKPISVRGYDSIKQWLDDGLESYMEEARKKNIFYLKRNRSEWIQGCLLPGKLFFWFCVFLEQFFLKRPY